MINDQAEDNIISVGIWAATCLGGGGKTKHSKQKFPAQSM